MIGNFYTLRAVALSLSPLLRGNVISGIFSQEKEELVIEIGGGALHLVVSCRQGENICFLHPEFSRARRNSADVLTASWPDTIDSVRLHHSDRILFITLLGGSSLVFLPFPGKSNVLLVTPDGKVADAFQHARELRGTPFTAPTREIVHDVHRLLEEGEAHPECAVLHLLRKVDPLLGRTVSLEILHRSGIAESATFAELKADSSDSLVSSYLELLRELDSPDIRVYLDESRAPLAFSLVPLHHLAHAHEERFADIHAALRTFVYRSRSGSALQTQRNTLVHGLTRWIERTRRSVAAIEEDLHTQSRADLYERYGSLLLTHLHTLQRGTSVANLTADDGPKSIPMDVKLSASANAQRYFEKAKRARRAARETAGRLHFLRERLLRAEALRDALQRTATRQSLETTMKEKSEELDLFGIGPRSKEREELPFRTFTVDGGFQVLAGKSSENNDLLTLHYARPHDLWFHARGAGGSHVVLRVGSANSRVSKKAKEQAAAIAAYYSKMRRGRLVPVAVTEKKYVHKPKGAPAGTVVLQREEVIFATPRLPEEEKL